MTSSSQATVLVTITGRDQPGVVSVIFSALTRHGVDILDVEQVVIRGRIILGVLVTTTADPEDLQEAAEQAMASIGMQLEVEVGAGAMGAIARASTHVVLVLGRPVTAGAFGAQSNTWRRSSRTRNHGHSNLT